VPDGSTGALLGRVREEVPHSECGLGCYPSRIWFGIVDASLWILVQNWLCYKVTTEMQDRNRSIEYLE